MKGHIMKYLVILACILSFGCKDMLEYDFDLSEYDYEFVYNLEKEVKEIPINKDLTRYVKTSCEGVDLYLTEESDQWYTTYTVLNEPHKDYCGPTAVKNLMAWYGTDTLSYEEIGEMLDADRTYMGGKEWATCAAACAGEILFCTNICLRILDKKIGQAGTRTKHAKKALRKLAPKGYKLSHTVGDPSMIEEVLYQLLQGNPILINELLNPDVIGIEGKPDEMHMSVMTGIEIESNVIYVIVANSFRRPLRRFMEDWSLKRLGSLRSRKLSSKLGAKPFEAIWYEKI